MNDKPTVHKENLPRYTPPMISIGKSKKRVLVSLKEGMSATRIANHLHLAKSTVLQHLKEMQRMDLTDKYMINNYNGTWKITKSGIDYLGGRYQDVTSERKGVGTTNWLQDRAHNIKIKLEVTKKPETNAWLNNWKANDKIKNNVFYTERFGEIVTTYTGKSLIFQLPILHFKDSEIALAEAGRLGMALKQKYELDVLGLKLGDSNVSMQLITQSHAVPNEPYAKFCKKHGFSYRDEMLEIDSSKSPELEFTDKEESHLHHSNYIEFVKDFAKQKVPKMSEIAKSVAKTQEQINELSQGQINTNAQLQSIISLMTPRKEKEKIEEKSEFVNYFG